MRINKYINVLILLILIILVVTFDSFKSISTQLSTILPNSEKKELLQKFNEFQSTKKVFLSVEGLNKTSLTKTKELEKELIKIEGLSIEKFNVNKNLEKYKNEYKFFTDEFKENSLKDINIKDKLEDIKAKLLDPNLSYIVDKYDPLELLKKENSENILSLKNNHLIIKEYAYISIFNIDKSIDSLKKYEQIYDSIQAIIPLDKEIKVFSPIFYFVENSRIIKNDVNKIIFFSTIVLVLLYLVILGNFKLLVNTLITLSSSILLALFISSFIFDKLSIFVLVFGISISTVAIDYMFHHYVHNHYRENKSFNKDVFLGMITTIGAFFIISFISFDLIKQICYFAIISLVFSYIQFALLYPKIGFSQKDSNSTKIFKIYSKVKPRFAIIFSIFIISISFSQIKFDPDLKNLDVNNIELKSIEKSFNEKLNINQNIPVLIKANTIDGLIKNARILKKTYPQGNISLSVLVDKKEFLEKRELLENINLNKIQTILKKEALTLQFKENYFNKAYNYNVKEPSYTIDELKYFGLEVISYKNYFISYANLPKDKIHEFHKYDFIQTISIKDLFENNLISIYNELTIYGSMSILFIILMILISTKKNYLISFTYILFPFSMILSLSFFIEFNILHLFMLFIFLSISIDFGIYMGSENIDKNTYKAVIYSLLSTFAGFGVLVFSKINALFSIGIIATIGILAISILLIILKRPSYDSKNI